MPAAILCRARPDCGFSPENPSFGGARPGAPQGLSEETMPEGGVFSEDRILGAETASPRSDKLGQGYRDDVVLAKRLVLKRSDSVGFGNQPITRTGQQTFVSQ
jgi:hypothetical protein